MLNAVDYCRLIRSNLFSCGWPKLKAQKRNHRLSFAAVVYFVSVFFTYHPIHFVICNSIPNEKGRGMKSIIMRFYYYQIGRTRDLNSELLEKNLEIRARILRKSISTSQYFRVCGKQIR